jgi:hypothetical protein
MDWERSAEDLLGAFLRMVPETYRPLAETSARAEAEAVAAARGDTVTVDDVVRGWIASTPADQRNGLVEVLDALGFDPETYAEELEAAPEDEAEEPE